MKKNNGTIWCDVCKENPTEFVAINPHAPLVKDEYGIGRTAMFLCRVCATGAIGASLIALGIALLELMR